MGGSLILLQYVVAKAGNQRALASHDITPVPFSMCVVGQLNVQEVPKVVLPEAQRIHGFTQTVPFGTPKINNTL